MKKIVFNLFALYFLMMLASCNSGKNENGTEFSVDEPKEIEKTVVTDNQNEEKAYFIGTGTEPFWDIKLTNSTFIFKTIDGDSISLPSVEPIRAADSNIKLYRTKTDLYEFNITISQSECTNAMSGEKSPYKVSIEYKKNEDLTFTKINGCGHYVTDYRLHDIWVLEELNGKKVGIADFSKELPQMEVNAKENTFSGHAGCNRMNGQLFFEKGLLRFANVVTTRMMCGPGNKEGEFVKALSSSIHYKIENNRLTLSNPDKTTVVFKKVD